MGWFKRDKIKKDKKDKPATKPKPFVWGQKQADKNHIKKLKEWTTCKVCGKHIKRGDGEQLPGLSDDFVYCRRCWDKRINLLSNPSTSQSNTNDYKKKKIKKKIAKKKFDAYQNPGVDEADFADDEG